MAKKYKGPEAYYEVPVTWSLCAIIKVPVSIASSQEEADSLVMENCTAPHTGAYVPESFEHTSSDWMDKNQREVYKDYEDAKL